MIKVTETKLEGCCVLEPNVFVDERGHFMECYNHRELCEALGRELNFVQDNLSFSKKGALRGIHFQNGENAQAKLVYVPQGKVIDVVVDLRKDSRTFGQHLSMELSSTNKKMLFIPRGFAHGFLVVSETALFIYKCDNYYNKDSEAGIRYDDSFLAIDWKVDSKNIILSEKDKMLPSFKSLF